MATGLALPVGPGPWGGLRLARGDEQDRNILALILGSDENDNAFQQGIGVGESMIFDINDPIARADILARVRRVFDKFERLKRFALREDTLRWSSADGEMVLEFMYVNLESDDERLFRRPFIGGATGEGSNA